MNYDCNLNSIRYANWLENRGFFAIARQWRENYYRGREHQPTAWKKCQEWLAGDLKADFKTGPSVENRVKSTLNQKEPKFHEFQEEAK